MGTHEAGSVDGDGGQDRHLVEVDASIDLVRADLDPGGSDTGALTRAVVAMHGSDLPFLDLPATTQKLGGPVTNRIVVQPLGL